MSRGRSSSPGGLLLGGALVAVTALLVLTPLGSAATRVSNISVSLVDAKNRGEPVLPNAAQGSVVAIAVSATVGSGETWQSTSWSIGGGTPTCANTGNHGSGNFTEYISPVTLPGSTPSPPTVTVQLYKSDSCANALGSPQSTNFSIGTKTPNPELSPDCDTRVALVLDESGSINSTSGATTAVRNGAKAFVNGLVGTGAEVAVIEFNSQARTVPLAGSVYNAVTSSYASGPFANYINGTGPGETYNPAAYSSPNYYTNWQDAFVKLAALPQRPELVVYLTDGDPTARNTASSFETGFPDGSYAAIQPAFTDANTAKANGVRIFAIGVGAAVSNAQSTLRLQAISGPNPFPQNDLAHADYTIITDFGQLQAALTAIGRSLCSVRLHVQKLVDDTGLGRARSRVQARSFAPANGWDFTGTVTVSPGATDSYRWFEPGNDTGPPSGGNTRTGRTATTYAGDGRTDFTWLPSPTNLTSQVVVTDVGKPGYHFLDVTCVKNGASLAVPNQATITISGLDNNDDVSCVFRDQRDTGRIKVVKEFVGSPTLVSLLVNGTVKAQSADQTFSTAYVTLPIGTHSVAEKFTNDEIAALYKSSYVCKNGAGTVVRSGDGTTVANGVDLAKDEDVTCTFTNRKDLSGGVVKSADPNIVDQPGGPVTFTVVVVNTSTGPVTVSSLVDNVFGDLDRDSPADSHSWISSECQAGAVLAPSDGRARGDDTYTCSFVGNVTGSPDKPHVDTVTIRLTDASGETVEKEDSAVVEIRDLHPSIDVTKSASPTYVQDSGNVTYTAVVTNTSLVDSLVIDKLVDSIYGDLINGPVKATCTYGGDPVTLPYKLLPFGESLVCHFTVNVSKTQEDTVTASGIDPDGNRVTDSAEANVTVGVTPPPMPPPEPPPPPPPAPPNVKLLVTKIAPRFVYLGLDGRAALSYDIRVRNLGPDPAPGTTLRDPAPAGATFVRVLHQPSQDSCAIGAVGKLLTCNLGTLVAAQSVEVRVLVGIRASAPRTSRNVAVASCTPEPAPAAPCRDTGFAVTRLLVPFKPPPAACQRISVTPAELVGDGSAQAVTVSVRARLKPVAGATVVLAGPGIFRTLRTGSNGTASTTVTPTKTGLLLVGLRGGNACRTQRVGIVGAATPPVTG